MVEDEVDVMDVVATNEAVKLMQLKRKNGKQQMKQTNVEDETDLDLAVVLTAVVTADYLGR